MKELDVVKEFPVSVIGKVTLNEFIKLDSQGFVEIDHPERTGIFTIITQDYTKAREASSDLDWCISKLLTEYLFIETSILLKEKNFMKIRDVNRAIQFMHFVYSYKGLLKPFTVKTDELLETIINPDSLKNTGTSGSVRIEGALDLMVLSVTSTVVNPFDRIKKVMYLTGISDFYQDHDDYVKNRLITQISESVKNDFSVNSLALVSLLVNYNFIKGDSFKITEPYMLEERATSYYYDSNWDKFKSIKSKMRSWNSDRRSSENKSNNLVRDASDRIINAALDKSKVVEEFYIDKENEKLVIVLNDPIFIKGFRLKNNVFTLNNEELLKLFSKKILDWSSNELHLPLNLFRHNGGFSKITVVDVSEGSHPNISDNDFCIGDLANTRNKHFSVSDIIRVLEYPNFDSSFLTFKCSLAEDFSYCISNSFSNNTATDKMKENFPNLTKQFEFYN